MEDTPCHITTLVAIIVWDMAGTSLMGMDTVGTNPMLIVIIAGISLMGMDTVGTNLLVMITILTLLPRALVITPFIHLSPYRTILTVASSVIGMFGTTNHSVT
jgi:hypothetical protein